GVRFGFLTIVKRVFDAWSNKPEQIEKDASFVVEQVQNRLAGQVIPTDAKINADWTRQCQVKLKATYDPDFGGFNYSPQTPNRPKFPEPSNFLFLIHRVETDPANQEAKEMLVQSCERMMMGGILDHIGGGFHRYSVDRFWKIPHFEKMLYDNAQLASVYAKLYKMTNRDDFKLVVDELLGFVDREMTTPEGGFYSALDAESEGEEGKFYRWEKEEIQNTLSKDEFKLFAQVYGIDQSPNFETEFFVPQLNKNFATLAKQLGTSESKLLEDLKPIRKKLFDIRGQRTRPITDTKVLSGWNGMMIRGYADAGMLLENPDYVKTAEKAAQFILDKMMDDSGRLFRTYTDGEAKLNAYVSDYACVIDGLIGLHQATGEKSWLDSAEKLQLIQDELFWDEKNGGYFYTPKDHEVLLARAKRINDGPVPSGNSVAAGNLLYLAARNDPSDNQTEWVTKAISKARRTALAAGPLLDQFPVAAPRLLIHAEKLVSTENQPSAK
ncbi:MAG: thioredoxin domain-containing protein, partial [Planctomycetota bacterium]